MNRSLILRLLQRRSPCSRADLAREAGLEQSTVTNIVRDMINWAARGGDPFSVDVVKQAGRYLGIGLVNLINSFNPQRIVIGDDLSQAGEPLLEAIREVVAERTLAEVYDNVVIELSTFTPDPVLVGAGALATEYVVSTPSMIEKLQGNTKSASRG